MKRSGQMLCCRLAIGLLTLPLLHVSCVEVAQRAAINAFFDGVTPLIDEQLDDCLTDAFEASTEP